MWLFSGNYHYIMTSNLEALEWVTIAGILSLATWTNPAGTGHWAMCELNITYCRTYQNHPHVHITGFQMEIKKLQEGNWICQRNMCSNRPYQLIVIWNIALWQTISIWLDIYNHQKCFAQNHWYNFVLWYAQSWLLSFDFTYNGLHLSYIFITSLEYKFTQLCSNTYTQVGIQTQPSNDRYTRVGIQTNIELFAKCILTPFKSLLLIYL